ncbi:MULTISPECIES: hypothetical protein [unclassified Variovorax]|jgi:hypothetical protein|uniref:hypothetical protein n=1 Tax=unclassified Variovorax TaxID=663243 RepID=UPI0008B5D352|nr:MULTISPECIES: hypothetical protein [unclassified Variovorax]SEK10258.1 hypothetical protein SAMN05518853_109151 [Variovorax sp. OK202]SFD67073.1 hypothetical protein SAMN05444746_109151 [Variovorax sp. OK212]
MNKTEVMATSIDMARNGLGMTPGDAFDYIAGLIGAQDPASELYDREVEQLLRLAACLWTLRRDLVAPGA